MKGESIAISVRGLGKRYRMGAISAATLREELAGLWARLRGRAEATPSGTFDALKDVSFDVPAGQVCGIIGRNGSGKTTLLKIVSSITAPDAGEVVMRGRVGSLLEVGAGFHPDMDGIENIYLNGAVLGMSRREIEGKLAEIIAFAGVGDFLRTPVKRYSSGMYVRLAFSVAAHLEPEILIVDEVLAVGDAEFQRRCIGKMRNVASGGRTVLFVSHNMAMVRQLCDMVVHLEKGRMMRVGPADSVIQAYLASTAPAEQGAIRREEGRFRFELTIREAGEGAPKGQLFFGADYELVVRLTAHDGVERGSLNLFVADQEGNRISILDTLLEGIDLFEIDAGDTAEIVFALPEMPLLPGGYTIAAEIWIFGAETPELTVDDLLGFEVVAAILRGASLAYDRGHGVFRLARGARLQHL